MKNTFLLFAETEFVSLAPMFTPMETAKLNDVREFQVDIEALPKPKITWHKDGVALGDNAAEFTTSLRTISETRLDLVHMRFDVIHTFA